MFGEVSRTSDTETSSNITKMLLQVDPIRDAVTYKSEDREGPGWANPIVDAFLAHAEGEPILTAIKSKLPNDDPFIKAITSFDEALDEAFTKMVAREDPDSSSGNQNKIRRYFAWYGEYLLRMYAVAHGIPAHDLEIRNWIYCWTGANEGNMFRNRFRESLRLLLFADLDGKVMIPSFTSRTQPLEESRDELVLVHDKEAVFQ